MSRWTRFCLTKKIRESCWQRDDIVIQLRYQMIPYIEGIKMENYRIESEEEISAYLGKLKYALNAGAKLVFQAIRKVDENREEKFSNQYTVAHLFPDEDPQVVLRRELLTLTTKDYMRTVKDVRFPNKSEMREFGKIYNGKDEIYIKIRVELLDLSGFGQHTTFVMSFHYAMMPFSQEMFPYRK